MTDADAEVDPLKEEIMLATYRALASEGYGGLTVQAIADEFPKSKSLLYYHYDGKEDLLTGFLDYALDQLHREIELEATTPAAQLRALVDVLLPAELPAERRHVQTALFDLRGEAQHDDRFREQYAKVDRTVKGTVAGIIRRGIEDGTFDPDLDPELEAELLVSAVFGARMRRLTTYEEFSIEETRRALDVHLDRLFMADDAGNADETSNAEE